MNESREPHNEEQTWQELRDRLAAILRKVRNVRAGLQTSGGRTNFDHVVGNSLTTEELEIDVRMSAGNDPDSLATARQQIEQLENYLNRIETDEKFREGELTPQSSDPDAKS